ncbi:MAG: LysM peptidoglycan-binding domain-containing protein [Myxococcota bacterium]
MKHCTLVLFLSLIACERSSPSRAAIPQPLNQPLVQILDDLDTQHLPSPGDVDSSVEEEIVDVEEVIEGDEPGRADRAASLVIRTGETLDAFARWTQTTAEEIASLNGMGVREPLIPGQTLLVPMSDTESFAAAREGAFERRIDRFLSRRGGLAGIEGYTVVTGDTAWDIARDIADVPTWILAAFNPDRSLDHLQVGDTLYLPVMTHVADVQEGVAMDFDMEEGCSN